MSLRDIAHYLPYHREIYVLALTLLGRNHWGLLRALREDSEYRKRHRKARKFIAAASHVQTVGPDGIRLTETPYGAYWNPVGMDLFSVLAERALSLYMPKQHGVREGDIVLDCGANVGVFVREALEHRAARVVAVEPSPVNVECLRRNFPAEIASGLVVIVERGVWNSEGPLRFFHSPNTLRDRFVTGGEPARGEQVLELNVTTIDRIRVSLALPRIDFIKMDIEGAEQQALAGAQETIASDHPRMSIATYHRTDDFPGIPSVVRRAWPSCRIADGPCTSTFGHVQPETLYFSD